MIDTEDLKKYSLCKKDYKVASGVNYKTGLVSYIKIFEKGKFYKTWDNFGGANKFAENKEIGEMRSFSPGIDLGDHRQKFYEYFYTIEEMRDIKIKTIL